MNFKGKSVLITGAGSGIGRATALLFAEQGAAIMVSDINESGGQETVAMIEKIGGSATFCQSDVADLNQVKNMVQQTIATFGKIDIAVNNAGIVGGIKILHDYPVDMWNKIIAVNQTGVFYCMQAELAQMTKQGTGGAIVNISSIAGIKARPYTGAYTAAKHAVVGLTKMAALEYAPFKIRVNAVCPVFTKTPMVEGVLKAVPEAEQKIVAGIPLGRTGQPNDIANAIVWLCADQTDFVTGHIMPVDGGTMA